MKKTYSYPLQINTEVMDEVKRLAKKDSRSINNMLNQLIELGVKIKTEENETN